MSEVVTGGQIAAARALAGVSQAKLAQRAGLELADVRALESRGATPIEACLTLTKARSALELLGAVFIDEKDGAGAGVRLKFGRAQTRAINRWEAEGGVAADDDVP